MKTLKKWGHNVERVLNTPSTVENRMFEVDVTTEMSWHLPASL